MALFDKRKVQSNLKKGAKLFKGCKIEVLKPDSMFMATIDFMPVYSGAEYATMLVTLPKDGTTISFELVCRKFTLMSDREFNVQHKYFFFKRGYAYNHVNEIAKEEDIVTLMRAYADYMLKGDFYQMMK